MKTFDRTDPQVVVDSLKQTLPVFKEMYKDYDNVSSFILEEAYFDLRVDSCKPFSIPMSRGEYNRYKLIDQLSKNFRSKLNESMVDDTLETPPEYQKFLNLEKFNESNSLKNQEQSPTTQTQKIKKGVEIKNCFNQGLSVQETITKMMELGAPTSKEYVSELFLKFKKEQT